MAVVAAWLSGLWLVHLTSRSRRGIKYVLYPVEHVITIILLAQTGTSAQLVVPALKYSEIRDGARDGAQVIRSAEALHQCEPYPSDFL